MSSNVSRRHLLSTGLAALGGTLATAALAAEKGDAEKAPAKRKGQLSLEALGNLLEAMGLKATKYESSFNFTFPFKAESEWNMTMTATMSTDEMGIWITAYLSELPQTSADVPRTALLRLLAQNDELGDGIFFAYIPKVRKIVLERMIANEGLTSASFKELIRELATRVTETQPLWTVSEWKAAPASGSAGKESAADDKSSDEKPGVLNDNKGAKPIKSATKDGAGASSKKSK
ncbi:MAG: type III secretion system chaperone [Planctomycetia bacterium]|nr:type III secretion system chaperone [Planctomycetia bacterium]